MSAFTPRRLGAARISCAVSESNIHRLDLRPDHLREASKPRPDLSQRKRVTQAGLNVAPEGAEPVEQAQSPSRGEGLRCHRQRGLKHQRSFLDELVVDCNPLGVCKVEASKKCDGRLQQLRISFARMICPERPHDFVTKLVACIVRALELKYRRLCDCAADLVEAHSQAVEPLLGRTMVRRRNHVAIAGTQTRRYPTDDLE